MAQNDGSTGIVKESMFDSNDDSLASITKLQEAGTKTVVFVAAADRGHFSWAVALAVQLKSMGYQCELFTHEFASKWAEEAQCFSKIDTSLGSGKEFHAFVAAYKWASSHGDSDCDGAANVCSNSCRGLQVACERQGFDTLPTDFDMFFSSKGKKQLAERLKLSSVDTCEDVVACVWERVWCDWAVPICGEYGIPNMGFMPSFLHPFRASVNPVKFWWFDNEERARNLPHDIDPPISQSESFNMSYILAKCLRNNVQTPPNRNIYGAFLLPHPPSFETIKHSLSESSCGGGGGDGRMKVNTSMSLSLLEWLDGFKDNQTGSSKNSPTPVILVSLGSQSCLSSLGKDAATMLLRGCLLTSCRVLAVGMSLEGDNELESTESSREILDGDLKAAVDNGRLRIEKWIDQWLVLHHEAVREHGCFLSHCGANSVHEALACGVRICPLPFFDDQYYIADQLKRIYYLNSHSIDSTSDGNVQQQYMSANVEVKPQNDVGGRGGDIMDLSKALFRDDSLCEQNESTSKNYARRKAQVEAYVCQVVQQALLIPGSVVNALQKSVVEEQGVLQAALILVGN